MAIFRTTRVLTLVGLCFGATGSAYASGVGLRLESVNRGISAVENRLAELEREYSHRRGLIGAHAADVRFENAVYDFLVGSYSKACTSFYTLVESEALVDPAKARDAEWYLAECLMEDGNRVTAVEAYQGIIDTGQSHPFFNDAVRRQLEAYGYLNDSAGFYEVYNRYIVTGTVPTTDEVRYSMGKSFYHQGDWTRAKSLFAEVAEDSQMYTRARYFMGAVLVAQGQYESAIPQFERVTQHTPKVKAESYYGVGGIEDFAALRAMESEVVELARLALGRIHYELGNYSQAQTHYRSVATESEQFADQLYELVWVYLRQDQWLDAVNQIEIFLIAFPEHQYAFRLRLLLGHLHMRRGSFERALVSYEEVVDKYGPIQMRLAEIKGSPTEPENVFGSLVKAEDPEGFDPDIPAFAISLLADDEGVGRAVEIRKELDRQGGDIEASRTLIEQVAPILQGGVQGIGTFYAGRTQIAGVQNDSLKVRVDVVDADLAIIEEGGSAAQDGEVSRLRASFNRLLARYNQIRSDENDASERESAFAGQVDAVQSSATQGGQLAGQQMAEVQALKQRLVENASQLSGAEISEIHRRIAALEAGLQNDMGGLAQAASPATKRRVMSTVGGGADAVGKRRVLAEDLAALRDEIVPLRRKASEARDAFGGLDEAWDRALKVERRSLSVIGKLERAEASELQQMRAQLSAHMDAVIVMNSEFSDVSGTANVVAAGVTRAGLGRVEGEFSETVMGADRGILDVYWTRKAQVSDEIERLGEERGLRSRELDDRFQLIRQRMGQGGGAK